MRARPPAVVESTVMGKKAVTVVVACLQVPAWGQLTGCFDLSAIVAQVGNADAGYTVAVTCVVAGTFLLASYVLRDDETQRVCEIVTNMAVTFLSAVYMWVVFDTNGHSIDGVALILAILAALVINRTGRAYFLLKQIWWVKRTAAGRQ